MRPGLWYSFMAVEQTHTVSYILISNIIKHPKKKKMLLASYTESVSQKQKNKYYILTHIYMESRKMVLMDLAENGLVDTEGEDEGGMN